MIKTCFKLCKITKSYRSLLVKCPRTSIGALNSKCYCDSNQNDDRIGKTVYLRKHRKVVNEIQLIKYENRFQNQRYDKLSPIKASDYRKWLNTVCFESEDSSLAFDRKFARIKLICRLYNDILEKTFRVPSKLTTDSMLDLMEIDSNEDITKQINYLYITQMKRWIEKEARKEDVIKTKERLELKHSGRTSRIGIFGEQNEIIYGLWHNTLFGRIRTKHMNRYMDRTRLKNSAIFGQKLIVDFGFEEFLNKISSKQLMSYLVKTFAFNKYKLEEPFDISFNNFDESGFLAKLLDNYFQKSNLLEHYIDIKSDSYLNHFDLSDLCYICPQADQPLEEYDHNAIYILPGVVYNRMDPPLSMMRVKHEGIQMKRIPVEEYAPMKENFHLEINSTLQILSHFRDYNNLKEGIELYLPKTVWKSDKQLEDEDETVVKKLFYQKMIGSQRKTKVYRNVDD